MRQLCNFTILHCLLYLLIGIGILCPEVSTSTSSQRSSTGILPSIHADVRSNSRQSITSMNAKRATLTKYNLGLWDISVRTSYYLWPTSYSASRIADFFAGVAADASRFLENGEEEWISFMFQERALKLVFTCMHGGGFYTVPWVVVVALAQSFEERARRGNPNAFTARVIGPNREWIDVVLEVGKTILDSASEIHT